MRYKIGSSTCGKLADEILFAQYQTYGIDAMEISIGYEEALKLNFTEIGKLSKKYNIKLWSFHLPFAPFEIIDISNPNLSRKSINYLSELIHKASYIGIDKFVIHSSGEPISINERNERINCAKESLSELAEIANKCSSVICVENLPRTCLGKNSDEIFKLISAHKSLRVCFDTNHLLEESHTNFLKSVGNKIITMHVSDYDFIDEKHWLPGEGNIDWKNLINNLSDIKYNGIWLYEVKSIKNKNSEMKLSCLDLKNNANKIMNL